MQARDDAFYARPMLLAGRPHFGRIYHRGLHGEEHPHPKEHATKYEKRAVVIATIALVPSMYVVMGFPTLEEYVKERAASNHYFHAVTGADLGQNDWQSYGPTQALGYASPDSPAAKYAKIRQLMAQASEAQGVAGKFWVTEVDQRIFGKRTICYKIEGSHDDDSKDFCAVISGERFDENFRLADFNYSDVPISEMLLPPGQPDGTRDLAVTVLAGEHPPGSEETQVVLELVNKRKSTASIPTTIDYRDTTKSTTSSYWVGPTSLEPGERGFYYVQLKGQHPGSISFTPKWAKLKTEPYWIRIP